jgi:hypothetical protein
MLTWHVRVPRNNNTEDDRYVVASIREEAAQAWGVPVEQVVAQPLTAEQRQEIGGPGGFHPLKH